MARKRAKRFSVISKGLSKGSRFLHGTNYGNKRSYSGGARKRAYTRARKKF